MRRTLLFLSLLAGLLALHRGIPDVEIAAETFPLPGGTPCRVAWFGGERPGAPLSLLIPGRGSGNRSMRWIAAELAASGGRAVAVDLVSAGIAPGDAFAPVAAHLKGRGGEPLRLERIFGYSDGARFIRRFEPLLAAPPGAEREARMIALGAMAEGCASVVGRYDQLVGDGGPPPFEAHDHFTLPLAASLARRGASPRREPPLPLAADRRLLTPLLLLALLVAFGYRRRATYLFLAAYFAVPLNLVLAGARQGGGDPGPPPGLALETFVRMPLLLLNRILDKAADAAAGHPAVAALLAALLLAAVSRAPRFGRRLAPLLRREGVPFLALEPGRLALLALLAALAAFLFARQAESWFELVALFELQTGLFRRMLLLPALILAAGAVAGLRRRPRPPSGDLVRGA